MLPSSARGRPNGGQWLQGLAVGALAGAVVLGAGGRAAMRGVAIVQEWTLDFSIGGSLTVVMMGTLAGVLGAVILLLLCSVPRLPATRRQLLFWVAAVGLTWRILQPVDRDRVVMFTPVVVVYGLLLQRAMERLVAKSDSRARMASPAVSAGVQPLH